MTALPTDTVACRDRDFVEWHGGCTHALVWAALVDVDGVRGVVRDARGRLGDILLPRYDRQPHVTVAYVGLVPADGATPVEAPVDGGRLAADLSALRSLGARPYRLTVAGWGSFPMVPYLRVDAPALHDAHRALHPRGAPGPYVPHVTLGHYRQARPMPDVAARLDGWTAPAVDVEVREWALLRYETRDIAGPLTIVGTLSLPDGNWTLHAGVPGLEL